MVPEIPETIPKNEGPRDKAQAAEIQSQGIPNPSIQRVVETHHARLHDATELCKLGLHYFLLSLELISAKHSDKHLGLRRRAYDGLNPGTRK